MNPKEILRADLLDILFDNRNKMYGAYMLRKCYNSRLAKAVTLGLTGIFGISLLVHFSHSPTKNWVKEGLSDIELRIIEIPEDKPVMPEARVVPKQRMASRVFNEDIQIVPDKIVIGSFPTTDELDLNQIGNTNDTGSQSSPVKSPVQSGLPVAPVADERPEERELLQRAPQFPGGKTAWVKFLQRYLTVPDELGVGERKTVKVEFLVSEDGTITRFVVIQSGGDAFDKEVIRVLKKMPKWSPAVKNGENVAVTFTQPVTFQSVEE